MVSKGLLRNAQAIQDFIVCSRDFVHRHQKKLQIILSLYVPSVIINVVVLFSFGKRADEAK